MFINHIIAYGYLFPENPILLLLAIMAIIVFIVFLAYVIFRWIE